MNRLNERSVGLASRGTLALMLGACPASLSTGGALAQQPAQTTSTQGSTPTTPAQPPAFKLFRYDEDYSALSDPSLRSRPLDRLKYIPLDDEDLVVLSIGGEARSRYEYFSAPFFGLRGADHDDFFLQRFLLHADLHVGDRKDFHGRGFVQILSGLAAGEEVRKPGNQDNALDLQQAFGEISLGDVRPAAVASGVTSVRLRAGRQEMGFGSFRLVTLREPTNARLAFDGARATLNARRSTFDAFVVRPVDQRTGLFNDGQDDNTTFWGVYTAMPLLPDKRLGLDLYYLGLNRENTRFQSGVGDELRHSLGARVWGSANGWDHDTEFVLQVGTFDRPERSENILAWTVASNTGYTFDGVAWKPRVGLKLNVASGDDDAHDGRLGTFNPLFPRNNYFGDANLLAPYNFFDIHPTLTLRPTQSLTLTAGLDIFYRYSTDDAVFSPVGIVIPASASDSRFVGYNLTLVADWTINRHLTLSASYTHFFKGDVVRDAGGSDVDSVSLWLTAKF